MLQMRFAPQTPLPPAPRALYSRKPDVPGYRLSDNLLTGFSFFATLAL